MSNETTMSKRDAEKLAQRPTFAPPVDIFENKEEILIYADVPGVVSEALTVHLDNDQLTIEARREAAGAVARAIDYRRRFVVPRGIDADRISANLQDGVLKLTLPKPAAMKPRQITVKAG